VKGKGSRVPRSNNKTRRYQDRKGEVKDVQKFLELANYYYQFNKNFIIIARLLHNIVKKKQK